MSKKWTYKEATGWVVKEEGKVGLVYWTTFCDTKDKAIRSFRAQQRTSGDSSCGLPKGYILAKAVARREEW